MISLNEKGWPWSHAVIANEMRRTEIRVYQLVEVLNDQLIVVYNCSINGFRASNQSVLEEIAEHPYSLFRLHNRRYW